MHTFKDINGREWQISLNGWIAGQLKKRLDFNVRDYQSIMRAADDPVLLLNVLFVICEEQAKAADVTDEHFGKAMGGDTIDAATRAFLDEAVAFAPAIQ